MSVGEKPDEKHTLDLKRMTRAGDPPPPREGSRLNMGRAEGIVRNRVRWRGGFAAQGIKRYNEYSDYYLHLCGCYNNISVVMPSGLPQVYSDLGNLQ